MSAEHEQAGIARAKGDRVSLSGELAELVSRALAEDLGTGDITSEAVVPAGARARARIVQKEPGVVSGLEAAREAFAQAGAEDFDELGVEARWREAVPAEVARLSGSARRASGASRRRRCCGSTARPARC